MEQDEKEMIGRHSLAHVMAKAIMKLYPDTKLTIGPAIEDGFYYDLDTAQSFTEDVLPKIEKEMKNIINHNEQFVRREVSKAEALKMFEDNVYKTELINELPEGEVISVYYLGDDFVDLCRGPHVESTGKLQNFGYKLAKINGAYWRGNEKNKMLQRIYAYAFKDKKQLSDHLLMLEEAKKRDNRKLGKELELFFTGEYAPGMPIFMPNGMIVRNELIKYWREMHRKAGYVEIETPTALNRKLWEISGHWDHYKQNMYTFKVDEEDYAIKPMNCPGGMLYYKESMHSYKELPLRVGELGKVHRHEASGMLHGLLRVRCFTQDDAHIFMMPSQIEDEIKGVLELVGKMYETFGLSYSIELSTMPENHIGDIKDWEIAETGLKNALDHLGKEYVINAGDGAFYGPKIDIHIKDAIGRTWQCGTIQLDMQLPKRFNLEYIAEDGSRQEPIMIHRVIFGSIDRFMGILIEHFAGAFPLWLSPVQVKLIPINQNYSDYANKVAEMMDNAGIRCEIDMRNESLPYRIRSAAKMKIPYICVIGEQEVQENMLAVRKRGTTESVSYSLSQFVDKVAQEIKSRSL